MFLLKAKKGTADFYSIIGVYVSSASLNAAVRCYQHSQRKAHLVADWTVTPLIEVKD